MSRKPATAKTKGKTGARRGRNAQKDRLIRLARRAGIIGGGVVFVLWLGTWLWLGGVVQDSLSRAERAFYEKTAKFGFGIDRILVEGRTHTDPDILLALLNIEKGDSLFAVDPGETRSLIERVSWIKQARVERRFPDTLYIGLTERQPMALWQNKGKIRVIDSEGVTLTDSRIAPFRDLIIVVGAQAPQKAPELLAALEKEPQLKKRVEAASWIGERRWDIKLKSGMTIRLPENDPGFALRRLARAQETDGLLDKDLTVIDLRTEDRIIVRTRPGAVQEYKAGSNI